MKICQLSIFLENKVGVINDVVATLGSNGVNMKAFSVAQAGEFGIMRLIVDDVESAVAVLQEANYKVSKTDVIRIKVPNVAGGLSKVMEVLSSENIFIEYMYAYSEREDANVVFRPSDADRCKEILEENREVFFEDNHLYRF
ncbi:MAG: ACT domain-containing protein [Rikenellaceae bacterium]